MSAPDALMKMCSISVVPMPSMMRTPVACSQASKVESGSDSPAETQSRRLDRSCSTASGAIAR